MSRYPHWTDEAACAGNPDPLWDAHVDGETPEVKAKRHARGKTICRQCPVRNECLAAVDPLRDDGIRGGVLLESLTGSKPFGGYGAVEGIVRRPWKRKAG
jgi:hypothetical protein